MEKQYLRIEDQVVHVSFTGEGPPLVLLHASPSSGKMFYSLQEKLKTNFLTIAPDIPGCGLSQPLVTPFQEIIDYVRFFKKLFDKLGLDKIAIYGTATGAQIAIRYALEYPEQISHLFLDNAADFSASESKEILKTYFPDLSPQYDGSHLMKLWTFVRDMFVFFPWSWAKKENRLLIPFPPAVVLQMVASDFLQAGKEYSRAYRAAFKHEKAEFVQSLEVATTLFEWQGSIVLPFVKKLVAHDFPENIVVQTTSADRNKRLEEMVDYMTTRYKGKSSIQLGRFNVLERAPFYTKLGGLTLHGFKDLRGTKKAILVLHALRSSAAVTFKEVDHLKGEHPIVAISLPGHGDSDLGDLTLGDMAEGLDQMMRMFNFETYHWIDYSGNQELGNLLTKESEVTPFPMDYVQTIDLPKIEIDEYGSHLIKAWFYLRDRRIFRNPEQKNKENLIPVNPNWDAEYLQLQLVEWMKSKV